MPDDLLIPLTNIIMVNETGQQIRFGKSDTDEEITLQPNHMSLYSDVKLKIEIKI